ncbi:MAG: hypothetical protein KRP56_06380 [Candidatus Methanogranum gryphiswaldense]|nr:MAG: hypothetical protein KRP56_06380 [Candidatus Methanogranum sp. U3.2.1]
MSIPGINVNSITIEFTLPAAILAFGIAGYMLDFFGLGLAMALFFAAPFLYLILNGKSIPMMIIGTIVSGLVISAVFAEIKEPGINLRVFNEVVLPIILLSFAVVIISIVIKFCVERI